MTENDYIQPTENTVLLRGEPQPALSPRQREVLTYRAMGNTQSEIAEELGISLYTVKSHLSTIDLKLGASGITDAISIAIVREEIDSEVLASQFDFEKYNDLNDSQKDTLAAISEIGDVTIDTLAFKLGRKPQNIKNRLSQIYSRLGIPSAISQAWLFAHLMPESTVLLKEEPQHPLSPRQKEVLMSRALGNTYSEVARKLGISLYTVKRHISKIDSKLGASGITDAITVAIERNEIDSEVLASQFDFENYYDLLDTERAILAAISEIGDVTIDTLAYKLGRQPQGIKNRLSHIYSSLGIRSAISQAWLFAHLMPENLKRA